MSYAEIEAMVEEMRQRYIGGGSYEPPKPAPRVRQHKSRSTGVGRGKGPRTKKHDRTKIRTLAEEGRTTSEIAEITGAHRASVWKILKEEGVTPKSGRIGAARGEYCKKGLHLMADHARDSPYGRYCFPCAAKRTKERRAKEKTDA